MQIIVSYWDTVKSKINTHPLSSPLLLCGHSSFISTAPRQLWLSIWKASLDSQVSTRQHLKQRLLRDLQIHQTILKTKADRLLEQDVTSQNNDQVIWSSYGACPGLRANKQKPNTCRGLSLS
jgi:hypothetical protein